MRSVRDAGLVVAMVTSIAGESAAQDSLMPPVRIELHGCERLSAPEVERIFAAELGVAVTDEEARAGTSVVIRCRGSWLLLRVDDDVSRKQSERVIELQAEDASAENRLVAIAAAELVLASWAELTVNPDPEVEPQGPPAAPSVRQAARRLVHDHAESRPARRRTVEPDEVPVGRALAVGSTRQIFETEGRLWGFGVRAGYDHPRIVSWTADALFETGTVQPGANPVSLDVATAAGAVFFHHRLGPVTGRIGAGLRAGVTTSSAGSSDRSTVSPWGWPLAALSATVFPVETVAVDLQGEAGYAVLPIAPANEGGNAIRGMWLGVQLGVGVAF